MTIRYYIIVFLFFNLGYGQYHHQKTWATYTGVSTSYDFASYAKDSQNNLVVFAAIRFYPTAPINYYTNLATANAYQPLSGGGSSEFLISKISPQGILLWATYYGGNGAENSVSFNKSIAIDSQDNIYIVGATSSSTGMTTPSAFLTTPSAIGITSFMTKFSPSGAREWSTYLYGNVSEILIDSTDTLFVTGITNNTSGVATTGSFLETPFCCAPDNDPIQSYRNGYINSFDKQGNRIAGTYIGKAKGNDYNFDSNGNGTIQIPNISISIACDPSGNVYVCGVTGLLDENTGYYASAGCYDADYSATKIYISKFTKNLTQRIWSTYYNGGSNTPSNFKIKAATATDLYFTSYESNNPAQVYPTNFTSIGCFQSNFSGSSDLYIVKFNTDGQRQWATLFGGNKFEIVPDLYVQNNKLYISGSTGSNTIATSGVYQETFIGGGYLLSDGFFCEFSTSGHRNWCSYFGGNAVDFVSKIIPFGNDSFYVVGGTASTTNISTPNALQPNINLLTVNNVQKNSFIARFDNLDFLETAAFSKSKISLYPNPNKGVFVLSGIDSLVSNQNLVVVDTQGRIVYKTPITDLNQKFELTVVPGMYFVKVMVANEVLPTIKFMVE